MVLASPTQLQIKIGPCHLLLVRACCSAACFTHKRQPDGAGGCSVWHRASQASEHMLRAIAPPSWPALSSQLPVPPGQHTLLPPPTGSERPTRKTRAGKNSPGKRTLGRETQAPARDETLTLAPSAPPRRRSPPAPQPPPGAPAAMRPSLLEAL